MAVSQVSPAVHVGDSIDTAEVVIVQVSGLESPVAAVGMYRLYLAVHVAGILPHYGN